MFKKKYIWLLIFLLIPVIFTTGIASWSIIDNEPITNPEYDSDSILNNTTYVDFFETTYDGNYHLPTVSDEIKDVVDLYYRVNGTSDSYKLIENNENDAPVNAGDYEFKIVPKGINESEVFEKYLLKINKRELTVSATVASLTYGDALTKEKVVIDFTFEGFIDGESIDNVEIDYSNLIFTPNEEYKYEQFSHSTNNPGVEYKITPSGLESINYSFDYPEDVNLIVNPKKVSISWDLDTIDLEYNKTLQNPTAIASGLVNNDTYELTYSGQEINANRNSEGMLGNYYTATVTGITNNGGYVDYIIDSENNPSQEYSIRQFIINVTANPVEITFGDALVNNGYTIDNIFEGDSIDLTALDYDYGYSRYARYGEYSITPMGLTHQNYEFKYNSALFNVLQKVININWTVGPVDGNFDFDGASHTVTPSIDESTLVTRHDNGNVIPCTISETKLNGSLVNNEAINAGNYNVVIISLSDDNYKVVEPNNVQGFTINPRNINNATFSFSDVVYDSTALTPTITFTDLVDGVNILTDADFDPEFSNNVNATFHIEVEEDKAKCIITGTRNYVGSVTKYFDITPATLTSSNFTWDGNTEFRYTESTVQHPKVLSISGYGSDVINVSSNGYSGGQINANYNYYGNKKIEETYPDYLVTVTSVDNTNYQIVDNSINKSFIIMTDKAILGASQSQDSGYSIRSMARSLSAEFTYVYNGEYQAPYMFVTNLQGNDTCTVTVDGAQINASLTTVYTAKAVALSNKNYEIVDEFTKTFIINPRDIDSEGINISIPNVEFTGSALTPAVTVVDGGINTPTTLTIGQDFTVDYGTDNVNVGTVTVTITGIGNYTGTTTSTFEITPKSLSGSTPTIVNPTYNGSALIPNVTIVVDGETLINGVDFEITATNNINVGTANITITGINNYSGTIVTTFEVLPRDINEVTVEFEEVIYTGSKLTPEVTITNSLAPITSSDYSYQYYENVNAGTDAYIIITGSGNYTGTYKVNFEIKKATADMSLVSFESKTFSYDGTAKSIFITGTLPENVTVEYVGNGVSALGTHTVTAKFTHSNPNYNLIPDMTATITINQTSISGATIKFENDITSFIYTGSAITPTITVKLGDNTLVEGTDFTKVITNNTNVGTATITLTGTGNYSGTISTTFEITQATISMDSVVFEDASLPYNKASQMIYVTNLPTYVELVSYTVNGVAFDGATNVGTYTIIATFKSNNGNYKLSTTTLDAILTITKINPTINVEDIIATYDGNTHSVVATSDSTGLITYVNNGQVNKGEYTVTINVEADQNFKAYSTTATITITARKITITAGSATSAYGTPFVTNGYSVTVGNIVNDADLASLNIRVVINSEVLTSTTPVGDYENGIIVLYDNNDNYDVSTISGSYTITAGTIDLSGITFTNTTLTYNKDTQMFNINNVPTGVEYTFTLDSATFSGAKNAGTYNVLVTYTPEDENYELSKYSETVEFTINKATVVRTSPTTTTLTKVYDTTPFDTIPGLSLDVDFDYTVNYEYSSNDITSVGSFTITAKVAESANYLAYEEEFEITITKATPVISNVQVVYDQHSDREFFTTDKDVTTITFTYDGIPGVIKYSDAKPSLVVALDQAYAYTFTPTDEHNYNSVEGTIEINVYATVNYMVKDVETGLFTLANKLFVPYHSTIGFYDLIKEGYTLSNWYKDDLFITEWNFASEFVTSNLDLYAKWNINSYVVTFYDRGEIISQTTQEYNSTIIVPASPVREGYTFKGWDVNDDGQVDEVLAKVPAHNVSYDAIWAIDTHSITFVLGNGEANIVITKEYGASITAPADPTRTGYTFAGWDTEIPSTMPAENMTITANWTINQYTITFNTNGGSTIAPITQDYGTAITKPAAPTKTGHTFAGWDTEIPSTMPAENMTITASWTINQYTITFNTNGGSEVASITQDYGTAITKPANPTKTGYTFDGWDTEIPSTMPAEDMTITASWTINQYTITFNTNGGSEVASITQDYGTTITAPADPTRTGYTFAGWDKAIPETMPAENMVITAKWTVDKHKLTFVLGNGQPDVVISQDFGTTITAPADPTRTGYTFSGWDTEIPETMPAKDMTITAEWTINQYTITFNTNGGSTIAPITQDYGTAITKPANPTKTGYTFDGWDTEIPTTMPAEDMTITASWTINQYTITFNTNGGSTIAPITQDYGTAITAPADPTRTGHTFAGWDTEIPSTMPAENMTITANWTINQYTITFDTDGGSEVASITQDYGTAITAPADPTRTGYTFAGWDTEIPSTMPAENMTITAEWTINQYTITFNTNGGSTIAPITQDYGTAITAPADPTRTGYTFAGWDTEIPSTMPAENMTITASWTVDNHKLTFVLGNGQDNIVISQDYGTKVTAPTDPTRTGYIFAGWDTEIPETMPAKDMTITAKWNVIVYSISYDLTGGSVSGNKVEYTIETATFTLVNPTRTGYTFLGWTGTGLDSASTEVEVQQGSTGNRTYIATWIPITYSINYNLDGGSVTGNPVEYTIESNDITLIRPTKEGHTFLGWVGTDLGEATLDVTISKGSTGDRSFTATWSINQYTITFDTNGGSEVASIIQNYGTTITAPAAPTRTGYTFAGWDKVIPATMPAEDMTITASWTIINYTINYDLDGGSINGTNPATYTIETATFTLINPTRIGYTFAGWTGTNIDSATMTVTIENGSTGDRAYKATWTPITYVISYNLDGGEVDGTNPTTYTIETPTFTLVNPTKEGYTFAGWKETGLDAATMTVTIEKGSTENRAYTATWKVEEHKVTFVLGNGQLDVVITQDYGTAITAPTGFVREGYTFAGWTPEVPATMPAEDMTITAKWNINSYTYKFVVDGVTVKEETIEYGAQIVKPADPDKVGHTFAGWSPEVSATMPASDQTFVATWTTNTYTYKFIVDGEIVKEETVEYGAQIVKPADPDKVGHTFAGWTPEVPATMPASDQTFVATWTVNTYTISFYDAKGNVISTKVVEYNSTIEKPAAPTKESTVSEVFTFAGWDIDNNGMVDTVPSKMPAYNLDIYPIFTSDARKYTITFVNWDNSLVISIDVAYNTVPNPDITPTRTADAHYTYEFAGWSTDGINVLDTLPVVTGEATYKAVYDELVNNYKVIFKDWDGTVLKEQTVAYGTAATAPTDPTRDGYRFIGWDVSFNNITDNTTVTAQYIKTHTVTFLNYDGSVLKTEEVDNGAAATAPDNPTRPADAQYTYEFAGWDTAFTNVTSDLVITATYSTTVNKYTIKFVNDDGTELWSGELEYGATPVYEGTPTKAATAQYTYTFAGWTPAIKVVKEDATYKATYEATVNSYTVVFKDWNGDVLSTQSVEYGKDATAPANPSREADAQYTYTFSHWNKDYSNITGNLEVIAIYSQTVNNYIVTFDSNGGSDVDSQTIAYGSKATKPTDPTMTGYKFAGWYLNDVEYNFDTAITGNITLVAKWDIKQVTITFKDGESVLYTITQNYNTDVTAPDDPTKVGYTFKAWDPAVPAKMPADDLIIYATWTLNTYTIKFVNWDGTELYEQVVEHGETPSYVGETPVRDTTVVYNYTFKGWTPEIVPATEDTTYTAEFTQNVNTYTVTFLDWDDKVLDTQTVEYGKSAKAPADPSRDKDAQYTYHFNGWDVDYTYVTSDLTVKALYGTTVNVYTVTFVNWDKEVLDTQEIVYGGSAVAPYNPTRPQTDQYTYHFKGWDVEYSYIVSDLTVTALYNSVLRAYVVTFVDWDGTEFDQISVDYGSKATAPDPAPTREGYNFNGWYLGEELYDFNTAITGNVTLIATYSINSYTVVFKNWNGDVLSTQTVEFGSAATAPENPTREGYRFTGWDVAFNNITDNTTVTAQYIKTYTVTFQNYDGSVLKTEVVDTGTAATAPDNPTRPADAQYTYTFDKWDKAFTNVTEDLVVTATYSVTVNKYTVIFKDWDGDVLSTQTIEYGEGATAPENPTRAGYRFTDWDKEFNSITADTTVTAQYIKTYTVTFKDWNGTVLKTETVDVNGTATAPDVPTREGYTFKSWDKTFNNITADTIVTAQYSINTYTVTFIDYDGTVLKIETVNHGSGATAPAEPTREGYTFKSWDKAFNNIIADTIVTAVYDINTYTVTFKDYDGTVLKTETVEHGRNATAPSVPERVGYDFTGWSSSLENITTDITVTAQYSIKTYTVTFKDYDGTTLKTETVSYGGSATAPSNPSRTGYDFSNWEGTYTNVTSDVTITAKYTAIEYTITYYLEDGGVDGTNPITYTIETETFTLINPTRNGYNFIGWTGSGLSQNTLNVTITKGSIGDKEFTANWKVVEYTISYDLAGGTLSGTNPSIYTITSSDITLIEPTRTGYTFAGWTGTDLATTTTNVTIPTGSYGNRSYTATWTINKYTITFNTDGGSVIDPITLDYGATITAPTDPTKSGYVFTGWTPSIPSTMPAENITITAEWISAGSILVRFYDTDGTTLLKSEVAGSDLSVTAPDYPLKDTDIYKYKVSWVNINDDTTIDSFDDLSASIDCKVVLVNRQYNVNIYYYDRDNIATQMGKSLIDNVPVTKINGVKYGEEITIYRQIKMIGSYAYYYYMSEESTFNWKLLYDSSGDGFESVKVKLTDDTLTIFVGCIQAAAVASTSNLTITSDDYNCTEGVYYKSVSEALNAYQEVSTTTYLRIFGMSKYSTTYNNCYLPTDSVGSTISKSITKNNETVSYDTVIFDSSNYALDKNYNIPTNLTVILPYGSEDTTTEGYLLQQTNYQSSIARTNIHSILTIPEGITLNVYGKLVIGGLVLHAGEVQAHSVLMNNGQINVYSNGEIKSFGFLKGIGKIESYSGSRLYDVYRIYDWKGGVDSLGAYNMSKEDYFPFNCYSFHNISCEVKVNYGATLYAWNQLWMSDAWATASSVELIGENGLFSLYDGYIVKKVEDTTTNTNINSSYTSKNQEITQREVIEIHGSFIDNSVTVTAMVSYTIPVIGREITVDKDITTSSSLAMPLGFMRIVINEGEGVLNTNSYRMLPGSSITISEGASLKIGDSCHVMIYDSYQDDYTYTNSSGTTTSTYANSYRIKHSAWYSANRTDFGAQLIVNGYLNCEGYIGGNIKSTGSGQFKTSHNYATVVKLTSLTYNALNAVTGNTRTVVDDTQYAKGRINNVNNSTFTSGVTYYYYNGSWGTPITISYNANGGISTSGNTLTNITVNGGSAGVSLNDYLVELEKEGYIFWGWYLDSSFTTPATDAVATTNTTLFAKWEEEFSITYEDIYYNNFASGNTSTNDSRNPLIFSESTNTELYDATNNPYKFVGWFLDSAHSIEITSLIGSDVLAYVQNNNLIVYGLWCPEDTDTYVIYYSNSNTDVTCESYKQFVVIEGVFTCPTLEDLSENNDIPTFSKYFDGWHLNGVKVTTLTIGDFIKNNETQLYECTLTAIWNNKIPVTVVISDNNGGYKLNDIYYSQENETYLVSKLSSIELDNGYELVGWTVTNKDGSSNNYMLGDTITISDECTMTAIIYEVVNVSISANNYSSATFTIKSGYYLDNSGSLQIADNTQYSISANGSTTVQVLQHSTYTVTFNTANDGTDVACTIDDTPIISGSQHNVGDSDIQIKVTAQAPSSGGGISPCVIEGTLITMADGTYKLVEDLKSGDLVLSFNHYTGKYEVVPVTFNTHAELSYAYYDVINMVFSDGTILRMHYEHYFFDLTLNKYVMVNIENINSYIGHEFATMSMNNGEILTSKIELVSYYVTNEYTRIFGPMTAYNLNLFTNNLLSIAGDNDPFINIFEYSDNMTFDKELMEEDIEKYGLFTYEDFKDYITEDMYNAYRGQYLKVAIEKGLTTWDRILELIETYFIDQDHGDDFVEDKNNL